ncbi:hypothetical protein FBY35_5874 [Streptomyces sp. SLBN-118]|uniref:hypothetical protein n=1 Tax=Streptomyces sp. SLBN-118 TaxID=2768454 RepID=UPI00114E8889|nr:hypothetical protein [Streptomyces sp. SLBN-118]TQK44371.1 hypothetical protein FBY35_5874 [Streptomyces sp. SLBN-118]
MSDAINPSEIPQFTGDLEQLETDTLVLTADAVMFRTSGALVHSEFQGLSAFYAAPEAEKLFATTAPVKADSDFFADQLETVSSALDAYATEVRPLAAKLKRLKEEATTFVGDIRGDEHWKDDEDKVDKNNDLLHDVNSTVAAFWEAERTCANKITALFCGTHYVVDDGSHGKNMYGFKGDDLDHAEGVPWGSKVEESHRWWEIGHWAKSFVWDGIIVDGVWGTIRGLGTLVGVDGWDAAGQAWTGLAKVATGLAITITPGVNIAFWALPDDKLPSWVRDSRTALKETGKALVAWDEWGKNPARAAGAVTFNVVTTVFTGGTGAAAKGGAVAKAVSVVGKAGRLIDPITYVGKAGKFATVKVGDLFANLKNVNAGVYTDLAAGKFSLPQNAVVLPDNTVKLVNPEGKTVYLNSKTGALLDQNGKVVQNIDDIPREVSAAERGADHTPATPHHDPVRVGPREPVAVGAHVGDNFPGGRDPSPAHGESGSSGHGDGSRVGDTPHNGAPNAGHVAGGGAGDVTHGGAHPDQHGGGTSGDNRGTAGQGGTSADPSEVMRRQVDRANNEPGYFEKYYKSNGNRLSTKVADESGLVPPQLVKDPAGKWISASDAPPPLPEKYIGGPLKTGRGTATAEALHTLDGAARTRHSAIAADQLAEDTLKDARKALGETDTPLSQAAADAADAAHKPLHRHMSEASEAYGEAIAEHHVIPEHYPNSTRETLDGPANGNDQFDQVWRREDGSYVVVEAKSSVNTDLGARNLADGKRVMQGTKEYFNDILREMRERGRYNPSERRLARELKKALAQGKLDYILVKGNANTGQYAGYTMRKFDIG